MGAIARTSSRIEKVKNPHPPRPITILLYEKVVLKEIHKALNKAIRDCKRWGIPIPKGRILFEEKLHDTSDWYGRTAMTEGMGKRRKYIISVSSVLFLHYHGEIDQALRNILLHELAHTCKGAMNHGRTWKKWVGRMNAHGARVNPKPYSKRDTPGLY